MTELTRDLILWLDETLRSNVKRLTDEEQEYLETVKLCLFHKTTLSDEQIEVLKHIRKRLQERYG